jgi:hypothetical protein
VSSPVHMVIGIKELKFSLTHNVLPLSRLLMTALSSCVPTDAGMEKGASATAYLQVSKREVSANMDTHTHTRNIVTHVVFFNASIQDGVVANVS